jgi:hypothetical protein
MKTPLELVHWCWSIVAVEVRKCMANEMLVEVSLCDIMANVPMRQLTWQVRAKFWSS